MGLTLPTPTVTPGPQYAIENNSAFTVIDSHNHTSGSGLPVPSAGININADLPFQNFNAITLRSTRFTDQGTAISLPSDLGCVYIAGGELWYNDGIGQQVQITAGGAINAASIGGIGGDYGTSTASVFYTSVDQSYYFWQDVNLYATMETGPIVLHPLTPSPFGVTLQAFPTLSADYDVTFPNALPASTKFVTIDATGQLGFSYDVDGTTIQVIANNLTVVPASVQYLQEEHAWELNGVYSSLTFPLLGIDATFIAPYDITIESVWIYNGDAGSGGTTEFDLRAANPGGAFASILSTTGKITSAAAANIWTDSGAVIGVQVGVTKPVISTSAILAGQAIGWDLTTSMTGSPSDARIRIFYKRT